jgi:N-sulfoglucosamine sulfohydrolase
MDRRTLLSVGLAATGVLSAGVGISSVVDARSEKSSMTRSPASARRSTLDAFLHRPAEELYDVASDPCEVVNLAGDAAHKAVLGALRQQLTQWRAATRDPWLPGQTSPLGAHAPGHE